MIIFIHIPRSAGTSLCYTIKEMPTPRSEFYRYKFKKAVHLLLRDEKKVKYSIPKVITGHMPYGYHKLFNADVDYITFLRNPVDRWISACKLILSKNGRNYYTKLWKIYEGSVNESDFLLKCIDAQINSNIMCRQLSGIEDFHNIVSYINNHHGKRFTGAIYTPFVIHKEKYSEKEFEKFYLAALEKISNFSFIGFQDSFKKDVLRMCSKFNWHINPEYGSFKRINSANNVKLKYEFKSVESRELIEQLNSYDVKFYRDVRRNNK